MFGRHGQRHTFLGLGEENLPGLQAGIFQRGSFEVQLAAVTVARHLADR